MKPIHSISKQYSIQTLERVYKHYYYIIRGKCRFRDPPQAENPAKQDSFLSFCAFSRSVFILRGGTEFLQPGKNLRVRSPVRRGLLRESRGEERRRKLPDTDNYRGFWLFSRKFKNPSPFYNTGMKSAFYILQRQKTVYEDRIRSPEQERRM